MGDLPTSKDQAYNIEKNKNFEKIFNNISKELSKTYNRDAVLPSFENVEGIIKIKYPQNENKELIINLRNYVNDNRIQVNIITSGEKRSKHTQEFSGDLSKKVDIQKLTNEITTWTLEKIDKYA